MNRDTDLQSMTERLSVECFGKPYLGQARLNPRLRTSAGRFLGGSEVIEVNPAYIDTHSEAGLIDTLKHELIHYHYPKAGHGPVFRREAARIGCSRFCAPLPGSAPRLRYLCQSCGHIYLRKRRVDVRKYSCGKCQGKLRRG
ncbi:MAG TPA: SprT family protein [Bacillota bacterium]|nr:SprT family protein [Bacillota bacterium]